MTGAAKGTVLKLLADLGAACRDYQDEVMVDLPCERIQCDEIWSFCYAKDKNVPEAMRPKRSITKPNCDKDRMVGSVWSSGAQTGWPAPRVRPATRALGRRSESRTARIPEADTRCRTSARPRMSTAAAWAIMRTTMTVPAEPRESPLTIAEHGALGRATTTTFWVVSAHPARRPFS